MKDIVAMRAQLMGWSTVCTNSIFGDIAAQPDNEGRMRRQNEWIERCIQAAQQIELLGSQGFPLLNQAHRYASKMQEYLVAVAELRCTPLPDGAKVEIPMSPKPMYERARKCEECKHTWVAPVEFSDSTPNLSGEKTVYCPECGSARVISFAGRRIPETNL